MQTITWGQMIKSAEAKGVDADTLISFIDFVDVVTPDELDISVNDLGDGRKILHIGQV
jgi:3-dehydroquinate synthase class II